MTVHVSSRWVLKAHPQVAVKVIRTFIYEAVKYIVYYMDDVTDGERMRVRQEADFTRMYRHPDTATDVPDVGV